MLFYLSDNLYPSLYLDQSTLKPNEKVQMVEGRIDEADRIRKALKKANSTQIVPYFWYNYQDTQKFVSKV